MTITGIAFVTYGVSNVTASRAWYSKILNLKETAHFKADMGEGAEYEIGPHTLAIGNWGEFEVARGGATAALEVDDFENCISDLKKKNVKFAMEPMDTGVCHMAIILDPDKNQIMIHKRK
jgi:predicted enzyme related to lactoylglutathione lyase